MNHRSSFHLSSAHSGSWTDCSISLRADNSADGKETFSISFGHRFLSASVPAFAYLAYLGFSWLEVQESIVRKLARAFPTILVLFAI